MYKESTMPGLFDDVMPPIRDFKTENKDMNRIEESWRIYPDNDSTGTSEEERISSTELREMFGFYDDGTFRVFKSRKS